jgi:hypothetical protein
MAISDKLESRLKARSRRRASATQQSAYALRSGLFGRFKGAADLALQHKQTLAEIWAAKHKAKQ